MQGPSPRSSQCHRTPKHLGCVSGRNHSSAHCGCRLPNPCQNPLSSGNAVSAAGRSRYLGQVPVLTRCSALHLARCIVYRLVLLTVVYDKVGKEILELAGKDEAVPQLRKLIHNPKLENLEQEMAQQLTSLLSQLSVLPPLHSRTSTQIRDLQACRHDLRKHLQSLEGSVKKYRLAMQTIVLRSERLANQLASDLKLSVSM